MDILLKWNQDLFLLINGYHHPSIDRLMLFFSFTGNGFILGAIVLVLLLFFDRKKTVRVFSTVLLAGIIGGIVVHLLKWKIPTLRPISIFPEARIIGETLKMGSFPSGHTQVCFSSSAVLADKYRGSWKFLYPWALIVGFSRIYIGAHFPFDVIVGGIMGYSSGKLVLWLERANIVAGSEVRSPSK